MQSKYQLKTPETEQEFLDYYNLRHKVLRAPWNQPPGSEKDELEDVSVHRMIVDENNVVVACGRLQFNSESEAQVRYLAVDDSCQGAGLGSMLLKDLETFAHEKKSKEIMLISRENALKFYEKNGYKIIKDAYTLFGTIKHKEMRKECPVEVISSGGI